MTIEEGRRIGYNDFSLRMSYSLSKRWVCVCVVENISRVFLSEWPPLHLWVMRVYIVWMKGKKVTHKNPPGIMFHNYLAGNPYSRDTRENDNLAQLFSFQSYAPYMPFSRETFSRTSRELVVKFTDLQLSLSLHQLNTNWFSPTDFHAAPTSFGKSLKFLKLQNTLYTLNRCELCLGTNLLLRYDNGWEMEKRLQWFFIKDE